MQLTKKVGLHLDQFLLVYVGVYYLTRGENNPITNIALDSLLQLSDCRKSETITSFIGLDLCFFSEY